MPVRDNAQAISYPQLTRKNYCETWEVCRHLMSFLRRLIKNQMTGKAATGCKPVLSRIYNGNSDSPSPHHCYEFPSRRKRFSPLGNPTPRITPETASGSTERFTLPPEIFTSTGQVHRLYVILLYLYHLDVPVQAQARTPPTTYPRPRALQHRSLECDIQVVFPPS